MKIQNNSISNPSFGHSFRVSICVQDEYGIDHFISPVDQNKLYRNLNSKIVGWLNEDYYSRLNEYYKVKNKREKNTPKTDVYKYLINDLKNIDTDYAKIDMAKSVYRKNYLTYIATGIDVPILENNKGAREIGKAKYNFLPGGFEFNTKFINDYTKAIKKGCLNYVKQDSNLLRSPNNKEIMLKVVFKEAGFTKSGAPNYELDSYEFHENVTKRTLSPVSEQHLAFKRAPERLNELLKTIQSHSKRIAQKKATLFDLKKIFTSLGATLEQKSKDLTPEPKTIPPSNPTNNKTGRAIQLTLDFKD